MIAAIMSDTATTIDAPIADAPRAARSFSATSRGVLRLAILSIFVVLIVPVGLVAIGSGVGAIPLPYEMFELVARTPYIFRTHMVASAAALLLLPAVIAVRHKPHLHKPLGRLLGGFVVIGGLTALPVAILSHSSLMARSGFFVQGLVWFYLLAAAVVAVRRYDIRRHAQLMLAMAAVTTGAVWFRLMTGTAILLQLPFEPIYAAAAWAGWIVPLAIVLLCPKLFVSLSPPA